MQPSILRSVIRAFLSSFSALAGIGLGLLFITMIFSLLLDEDKDELEVKTHYSAKIMPNADDVRKAVSKNAPVILKVDITGTIGVEKLTGSAINELLTESREGVLKDDRVKALLIYINTPGGTVTDSDGIYRAIKEYKARYNVPVYAYVDGICASGGMYVASACDKIYASDVSLVGSIGVLVSPFFNVTGLMEKLGLEAKTLAAGKGKDELNPFRPWKEGEADSMKSILESLYAQFVDIVASNRPEIDRSRLVNDYGAHIFSAAKAEEYGFIDGIGMSLEQTIKLLAEKIGIEDDYYQVVRLDRKILISDFFSRESPLMQGKVKHQLDLCPGFDLSLSNQFLYLYAPN